VVELQRVNRSEAVHPSFGTRLTENNIGAFGQVVPYFLCQCLESIVEFVNVSVAVSAFRANGEYRKRGQDITECVERQICGKTWIRPTVIACEFCGRHDSRVYRLKERR
jgi:hypothetical protein